MTVVEVARVHSSSVACRITHFFFSMRTYPNNPKENALPPSVDEPKLIKAVSTSGFPLQGRVAEVLARDFTVVEEWGFIDCDSGKHRSLDISAYRPLAESRAVRPYLRLLVECKRTEYPYVFFANAVDKKIPHFPHVYAIPTVRISDDSGTRENLTASKMLGLDDEPFVDECVVCSTFVRVIARKNGNPEVSGDEQFNKIVLPLAKARDHITFTGGSNERVLNPTLLISLCVVDGPLILVESHSKAGDPVLCPWVRIFRREAIATEYPHESRQRFYAIDVVHAEFFEAFVNNHLTPFADLFAQRAIEMEYVLRHGGRVNNIENWTREESLDQPLS